MVKPFVKYLIWSIAATLWATICFIAPDFIDNPIDDIRTTITIGAYILALGIASFWIIYLIGINKYVTWLLLPIFALGGATVSYYRVAFHATITPMIIDATLHTNGGTIAGVISWQLVFWLVVNLCIAICFILWRNRIQNLSYSWIHALIALGLLVLYYNCNGRLHISINQRYPYNVVHSFIEYNKQQHQLNSERLILDYNILSMPDSLDVIFVLGEAVRADHIQLNGYERETTPLLSARRNVVSMPHIYSEYTYTSTSVPLILSPADSIHPERIGTHYSFIHTFNECGYQCAWISNQDNGRTYSSFIYESDTIIFPNASKSVFVFDPWFDEQLLPALDSQISHIHSKQLFVLHAIGSHWYYNLHVPSQWQYYQPITQNRIVTDNSYEQIVNSYDNTILYMDVFLDSIVQRFKKRNAILIYLSDHGESLGEKGEYLHAGESEALHHPACIIWYSDRYAKVNPEKIAALITNKDKRYRTDFLFYSILYAAGIEAEGDNPDVNIFRVSTP